MKIPFFLILLFLFTKGFCQNLSVERAPKSWSYGIKDSKTKKWLTKPVHYNITEVKNYNDRKVYFYIAVKDNKTFLISSNGVTIVSPQFDDVKTIYNNYELFIVKNKGEFSFFKPGTGLLKEPGSFSQYFDLYNGIIKIMKEKKYSVFDANKNKVCPLEFDEVSGINYGSDKTSPYLIAKKGKWGICDLAGKVIEDFIYDSINLTREPDFIEMKKNGRWQLSNHDLHPVLENKYEALYTKFLRNFPDSFPMKCFPAKLNSKWGMLNEAGKWIIPNEYDSISHPDKNKNLYVIKNAKMGLIDLKNKILYPFIYNHIEREDESCLVPSKQKNYLVNNGCKDCGLYVEGGKWGMTDSAGKIIHEINANMLPLKKQFTYVNENYYGADDSTLVGYVWNIGGEKSAVFKSADSSLMESFDEVGNSILVTVANIYSVTIFKGGKTGIMGRDGKIIIQALYDDLKMQFTRFSDGEMRGVYPAAISDKNSIPLNNNDFYTVDPTLPVIVKAEQKWGAVDWSGKEIIPPVYDSVFYDNTNCNLDENDSVYNARSFPKRYFQVYKNGLYGNNTFFGAKLCDPLIEKNFGSMYFISIDSVGVSYDGYNKDFNFGQVVLNNTSSRDYFIWKNDMKFDEIGNEFYGLESIPFKYFNKAKFNLQNTGSVKFMSDKWSDDIMLIDKNLVRYHMNSLSGQLEISYSSFGDSITETKTGKKIDIQIPRDNTKYILDYYFAKRDGLWYLHNIFKPQEINPGAGFDSVEVVDSKTYKACTKNKYAYYRFKSKGPFENAAELMFPDEPSVLRMACRNCTYTNQEYKLTDSIKIFDFEGNERDTVMPYIFRIPLIKEGEFNLLNENDELVFYKWPNDIIIPADSAGHTFNLKDKNSFTFDKKNVQGRGNWNMINQCKKSVAIKYGDKWRLTTIQKPEVYIGDFKDIRADGNTWVCTKKRKTKYYTMDGLKKIKK